MFWLPKFVVEARKENGEFYSTNSIYGLCCGLQRSMKEAHVHVNIFTNRDFDLEKSLVICNQVVSSIRN